MHRFFVPADIRDGAAIALDGAHAHQIARVLRLRVGEEIVLVTQTAQSAVEWKVRLESVEAKYVRGSVIAERAGLPEPHCVLTLAAAVLKGERFDWLLQKATELGAATIQPLITARTIRRTKADDTGTLDRWRRIVVEAAEQSGRSRVPNVLLPVPLGSLPLTGRVLIAHETEATTTFAAALPPDSDAAMLLIGPEGGFAEEEVAAMVGRGAVAVSLGARVLRAETAAIAAVTLALAVTNDIQPPIERAWYIR